MNHIQSAIASGILLGALFSHTANAQQIPYINSVELINKGVRANDEGDYKKAISYFKQVPEGDTNYLTAIYEQSLSSLNDTNYAAVLELSQKALKNKYKDRRAVLLTMGTAYDESGKEKEALQMYDSVMKLFPHDNRPYFEKAVTHFKKERYAEAEALLQQSLMFNPLHFRSHYLLGSIYASQGRLSEAILALQASLLCTNNVKIANGPIALLNSITVQTDEISEKYSNRKPEHAHPVFDEIDEIVHAKLAFDKGYKLKTSVDDNIFRQIQVVMEKLSYDSKDKNFAMQYYVPLFKSIYDKDQFESFVLLLFSEYGIESIDKMAAARKGKAKLEEVKSIVFPYLAQIGETRVLDYEKRLTAPEIYHSFSRDNSFATGAYSNKETKQFAPGLVQFYNDQNLVASGNYGQDGKKTGTWNYYYTWDRPRLQEEYKNGTLTGEATGWYENGNIRRKVKLGVDGIAKEKLQYDNDGTLMSKSVLKGAEEYEVTYYFKDGSVKQVLTFIKDKLKDGNYTVMYPGGKINKEMGYKNEKLQGAYKIWYANGKPDETCTYQGDKIEGEFLSYHENGKLAAKYNYENGLKEGPAEEYRDDGSLALKRTYRKGKSDGTTVYYNKDGKIYGEVQFRNDKATNTKFLGMDGKIVSQQEIKDQGRVDYYNEYGILRTALPINDEGAAQGKANYYFLSGSLKEEREYKNDILNGASVTYFKNGNPETRRQYKDGNSDGYYQSYSSNGTLQTEGWIKDNVSQGVWHNYGINGKLSRDFFLVDDELNGPEVNYESNGKKDYIHYYDNGMIVGIIQFDSTGKVLQETTFDKGEGQYKMLYFNGNPGLQCALKHGKLDGPYTIQSPDKKLIEKGTYQMGKRDGECITYYPNGKMRLISTYKKGQKNGVCIDFEPDEAIESITMYQNNEMEGTDSVFAGGLLRYVTQYHSDVKDGKSVTYGDNGKIAGVLYYDRGTITGYSYEGADGKLLPVIPVIKGTADIKTYYSTGAKALELTFVKNCYEGSLKLYYTNGNLAEDRNFVHDDYEGPYIRFNPDGSKLYEINFKKDIQQGEANKYDNHGNLIFTANYIDGQPHGKARIKSEGSMKSLWYYYGTLE